MSKHEFEWTLRHFFTPCSLMYALLKSQTHQQAFEVQVGTSRDSQSLAQWSQSKRNEFVRILMLAAGAWCQHGGLRQALLDDAGQSGVHVAFKQ